MTLAVSLTLPDNPRTRPILDGIVRPRGLSITPTVLHPSEMFWRQLRFAEFDISEMSLAALTIEASRGRRDWAALPVFSSRRFFHTSVLVRRGSGIEAPTDLAGKRIGVPEYQQTWAVWSRGILKDQFGVLPEQIEWFMERGEDRSHAAATGFRPPEGVRLHQIPPTTDIGQMLMAGELDATLLYLNSPNQVDRSSIDLEGSDQIRTLFPDPEAEARRYYDQTGIYPINHMVVIRRTLLEANPWMAQSLYDAFVEAKALVEAQSPSAPPAPYGLEANRRMLETFTGYAKDQGLSDRLISVEELFAPGIG